MTDAEVLRRMGTNGAMWAAEFKKVAARLGYSDMDEGWLIGWFSNAIEAGRNAGKEAVMNRLEEILRDVDD